MSLSSLIITCLGECDALVLARQQASKWSEWLQPIESHSAVGDDPGYDDDFQAMREEVNKLSGSNVERVVQLAEKLLKQRCKDLRIATYYLWARLHKDGEAGLADGICLLAALVERFAADVLPSRPNSRRMAVEWLASGRVLDSLSLYPEVVKSEARQTVAALAWLEEGLSAWPENQRPALDPLYAALSNRLAQSGGVDAVVPQNSSIHEAKLQSGASAVAAIKSGRDLLDSGRALAGYLREQPLGWLAAHRLMKSLRWDTVHQAPPEDGSGHTRLAPPRSDYRSQLKRLYLQQSWSELLDQVERIYAEGVNHFWLDLQWYLCQALSRQPAPQDGWADIVKRDLGMLLDRLPGLETLCWSDGTPFADEVTRDWIVQHVSGNRSPRWLPAQAASAPMAADVLALESEALAQADSAGVDAALAWLAARPGVQSGRQRWLLRLLMARIADQCGKADLAVHLLGELEVTVQRQGLAEWEPDLTFEVQARLLKLLRSKAQRNDADKAALFRRMDALLAALVALDPIRAAVLCG
ncbi:MULTISPECIES: type VI secretion system protein TssA [unclassified Pseudomonas]|uniref:type VI secretion system protein TssA n=1 Tax=unclassified Pseudomonas TaxID=196821 RepID=UPI00129D8E81|nr:MULTISPECIES: type VI secretion system protein TssA [unclassified Pseudomonas]MDH4653357.1 type VI secretion system protein TssA [Pseudomonas sp. BN606]MRK20688.1 type VI secretion system protein TssA [Pseudomonas sp. JG-B]